MYNDRQLELVDRFSGRVQPYMLEARRRGVKFDMGHGAGSFLWPVATRAMAQGFVPDSISTDLHGTSILGGQPDMPNCMSKMMLLGMKLQDAVLRSTVNPAKQINRYPELGTLGAGKAADIAVLDLRKGVFAFKDAWGVKRLGTERLENVLTIRDGSLVYDRDARGFGAAVGPRAPQSQEIYDLLLKNGQVLDPANHRAGRMDVAVIGGKIAHVGRDLPAARAHLTIDAGQYYVTPGLIDINTHFDPEVEGDSVQPDHNALPNGVTTAITDMKNPGRGRVKTRLLSLPEGAYRIGLVAKDLRFKVTAEAIRQGSLPETIATGLDAKSVLLPRANMMTMMSELLNLGMSVEQLVERATVNAARAIRHPELGSLSEGTIADIALLEVEQGKFGFLDADRKPLVGDRRLRCVLTVRNGAIVWDSDGLSATDATKAGPYTNFK
jgi:predicted amidohydrolase